MGKLQESVTIVEGLAKELLKTYPKPMPNECYYMARRIVNYKATDTFLSAKSQLDKMIELLK